jgi:putative FmdB family regulatory protein
MPLYKYRCTECEDTFKVLQKNGNKDELPECPECGSSEVERMISSVGIRFKGNGFYRTDYDSNSNYKDNGGKKGKDGNGEKTESKSGKEVEGSSSGEG